MMKHIRWLLPAICFAFGLYVLRFSFRAYREWQELVLLGDLSAAEIPEVEFWASISTAILLIVLGAILMGRWLVRKP